MSVADSPGRLLTKEERDFVTGVSWHRMFNEEVMGIITASHDAADALLAAKDARIAELEEEVATTEQLRFEENRKACDRRDRIWELEALLAEQAARLAGLRTLVDAQANDRGLWFAARSCAEGYLQQELRKLHAAVESAAPRAQETDQC